MICTSAVKESITNIYGNRFECFTRNFEKSFSRTLKTLLLINEASTIEQGNTTWGSFISSSCDSAPNLGMHEAPITMEEFQENPSSNSMNQPVLHGKINQQLAHVSNGVANPGFNQSILGTFERSIVEQTCSNDLKASTMDEFQENPSSNSMNQPVLHGKIYQQLAHVSDGVANPGFNQSIMDTFERSIVEQTCSNDLKASTMDEFQENPSLNSMNQPVLLGKINQQLAYISNGVANPGFNQSILHTFERSTMEQTCSNDLKASTMDKFQENPTSNSMNQLILHEQRNKQVAHVSNGAGYPGFNESILNAFERSVMEQTHSNYLKEVELSLIMKKLRMKQSQLALTSHANLLEKIKISMGISKAAFEEEKLKNQMQNMKHAELLKRCTDLLVTGLIIMSGFLLYGASIYSYQRITEATSTCVFSFNEPRSRWIPKPVASFSSGWLKLRCHFVALTRTLFGILMFLSIACLIFQRCAMAGPTMPVTFILLLLGVACGFAGKFCIDTLGGNGYRWLLYWEALCLLHFFANVFPSALYHILYGPVCVSQGAKVVRLPYWIRRFAFYSILFLVLPAFCGLLPFASIHDWKEHFSEKITLWSLGNEYEV